MSRDSRVHYMDNLRALAMLLGIFFHAALAYSPSSSQFWLTASPQQSQWVESLAFFSHTFRMPLFFIIAGFFAALLVQNRGLGATLKNRLMRVTLPFVIFLPLVLVSFAVLIGWAMEQVEAKSPMLGLITMMSQVPDAPSPPLTTTHLWFLYNLTFFYLVATLCAKYLKINWTQYIFQSPLLLITIGPVFLVPALMTQHAPIPAPEQFIPQLWSFGFYGVFFALGWALFKQPSLLDKLKPYLIPMLLTGIGLYAVFYSSIPKDMSLEQIMIVANTSPEISLNQLGLAVMQAYISVTISLSMLIIGRMFLDKQNVVLKVIADSSYWIYIIHLPVLWCIQFLLLDNPQPLLIEIAISSLGTIFIGFVSYLICVKWTPIGWLLNGRNKSG